MAMSAYDDLQLRIDRDADGTYRVLAMAPDGRTARGSFVPPIDDDELDEFVQRVGLARRRGASADMRMEAIKRLGSSLFDSLIKDDIGTVFYSARSAAAERDRGLRITMRLSGSPELMRLPWEFLYKRPRFLAQSTQTPVVRALDVDSAMRPERLVLPLRILAMVSSPSGYPELDADSERRNLERALAGPQAAGLVELSWLERATLGELTRRVSESEGIHVLHYIGHGAYDDATDSGILVLETPQGRAQDVSGEEIGAILQDETSLRLVVLNACEGARTSHVDPFSGVAASLVNFDIPAVIGMQFEITDDAAITFSESLYTGLAHGMPVDAALAPARRAIVGAMLATEFGTPVLFLRDGNARLFDVQDVAPATARSVATDARGVDEVLEADSEPAAPAVAEVAEPEMPAAVAASAPAAPAAAAPVSVAVPTARAAVEPTPTPTPAVVEPTPAAFETTSAAAAGALPTNAPPPSRPRPVIMAVAMALSGALLLAVSAVLLLVGTFTGSTERVSASVGAQVLAGAALAVHYSVRPNRDATAAAFLYGGAAVLGAIVLVAIGGDPLVPTLAHLGSALLLIVIGWWLIRAARHGGSPFAVSLQAPAAGVLVAGFVSAMVEIVALGGASWPYNWLWPLSTLGMAAGYGISAIALVREKRRFDATDAAASPGDPSRAVRIQLPVTLAWTAAVALVVLVVAALSADPYSTEAQLGAAIAQTVALAVLATCHAMRPRHDSRFAVVGYALAAAVSIVATEIVIIAAQVYELYAVIPWTDLAIGVILGAVGVWLAAVGRASGGPFGRSLWIPGPFVIVAGAMTALAGAVALTGSGSLDAVIVWAWPLAIVGMAVGYALSAVILGREATAEPSASLVAGDG
jgi:hypothetical protein